MLIAKAGAVNSPGTCHGGKRIQPLKPAIATHQLFIEVQPVPDPQIMGIIAL
jgi:hypothetical protein